MLSNRWIVGILLFAFCVSLLMAALTTTKRIAIDRPSPSLKLRQSKASNEPGAVVAYRAIFRLTRRSGICRGGPENDYLEGACHGRVHASEQVRDDCGRTSTTSRRLS